jgi:hypothetical protein
MNINITDLFTTKCARVIAPDEKILDSNETRAFYVVQFNDPLDAKKLQKKLIQT